MGTPPSDELASALTAAEEELIERVEEACALEPEAPGVENTGELVRLEVALQSAAKAAEKAIDLRRQRSRLMADDVSCGVREFPDGTGREWRLWAVTPIPRESGSLLDRLRPDYRAGWLTFEALDGTERRRLPRYPGDWAARSVSELQELLAAATPVPPRGRRDRSAESPEPPKPEES